MFFRSLYLDLILWGVYLFVFYVKSQRMCESLWKFNCLCYSQQFFNFHSLSENRLLNISYKGRWCTAFYGLVTRVNTGWKFFALLAKIFTLNFLNQTKIDELKHLSVKMWKKIRNHKGENTFSITVHSEFSRILIGVKQNFRNSSTNSDTIAAK